jgi:hypothetical protein
MGPPVHPLCMETLKFQISQISWMEFCSQAKSKHPWGGGGGSGRRLALHRCPLTLTPI